MLLEPEVYRNKSDLIHISESALTQEIAKKLTEYIIPRMNVTKNTDGLVRVRIKGEVIVLSKEDLIEWLTYSTQPPPTPIQKTESSIY